MAKGFVFACVFAAMALALSGCAGSFRLGSDNTGVGANLSTTVDNGLDVNGGVGAHVLGHGFHLGTKAEVE